tara:strand:- start:739 stop:1113 length:375 start_codon:yes stop_codon:yes gene_type:complete
MYNQLEISSYYTGDSWVVESSVKESSDNGFPRDIFLWTLESDGSLGEFKAIAQIDEVAKYSKYDSARTNNFGMRQVRYSSSKAFLRSVELKDDHIVGIKKAFNNLLTGWTTATKKTTEVYPWGS